LGGAALVAVASVKEYWPEPEGESVTVPRTVQLLAGKVRLVVERTEKVKPGELVKVIWKPALADITEPFNLERAGDGGGATPGVERTYEKPPAPWASHDVNIIER